MKSLFFLFIFILSTCPCLSDEIDMNTILKATRKTTYGENIESEMKNYVNKAKEIIPNSILTPTATVGAVILNKKIEFQPFKSNFIKYDYNDRRISYEINFSF